MGKIKREVEKMRRAEVRGQISEDRRKEGGPLWGRGRSQKKEGGPVGGGRS
jgi:hypothetical protein